MTRDAIFVENKFGPTAKDSIVDFVANKLWLLLYLGGYEKNMHDGGSMGIDNEDAIKMGEPLGGIGSRSKFARYGSE